MVQTATSRGAGALTLRIVVRAADARVARDAQALLADAGIIATALAGPFRDAPDGEDIRILADDRLVPADGKGALLSTLIGRRLEEPPALGLESVSGALAPNAPSRRLAAAMAAWTRVRIAEDERE